MLERHLLKILNNLLKISNRLILIFIFLFIFNLANSASTTAPLKPSCEGASCTWCHFFRDFKRWLDFFVEDIALPIGGVLIVFSGILYIFSGPFSNLSHMAQRTIVYTLLGTFLILASWTIVSLIMKLLLKDPNINPWSGISC
jgi:hypothetical protein